MTGFMAVSLAVCAFILGVAYGVAAATWLVLRLRGENDNTD